MTEGSDACVETQTTDKDLLDVFRPDGLEVLVERALSNNDDALALANTAVLLEDVAHCRLPVVVCWRVLWDEDEVGSSSNTSHES